MIPQITKIQRFVRTNGYTEGSDIDESTEISRLGKPINTVSYQRLNSHNCLILLGNWIPDAIVAGFSVKIIFRKLSNQEDTQHLYSRKKKIPFIYKNPLSNGSKIKTLTCINTN
ncbi:MAG: hypothetical protein CM1200mP24_02470 [Gammaproteobacteria bacterium]|nr:MAG: hypothetical protein CM1200mP24_02470 [Gammaproteobacteria bacterium]